MYRNYLCLLLSPFYDIISRSAKLKQSFSLTQMVCTYYLHDTELPCAKLAQLEPANIESTYVYYIERRTHQLYD